MSDEMQLIKVFYTCFQQRDWKGMVDCYDPDIFFYDPIFQDQEGPQVRAMWEMLLTNANDLLMTFSDVKLESGPGEPNPNEPDSLKESYGSCNWVAAYTFSRTGRRIVNKGRTWFTFRGGKIVEHQDYYNLWKWCRQALGIPGILLGWTPFFQNKIRRMAKKNLEKFIARSSAGKT
jgi:ketosteroid isomerase-like protein